MDNGSPLPTAKRVRWDDSVVIREPVPSNDNNSLADADTTTADTAATAASLEACSCHANDAIRLVSVSSGAALSGSNDENGSEHRPEFTHQLFDEERIMGYADGEVTIRVLYVATSLHFLVKIETSNNDESRKADILSRLSKALPPQGCYSTDELEFSERLEQRRKHFTPPGSRVHEYQRGKHTFSVYRATGEDPGASEYHSRAQSLAPWFIETADPIDIADDRWEVFFLFQEETAPCREVLGEKWRPAALAGYVTVFGFRNPVKGISLRVCQALVLPEYQRQGHGQELLTYVYELARERESVFEITVEDPAPGFEKMRNLVDARLLRDHKAFPATLLSPGCFQRPAKESVQAAHEALKLTVSQVEIGFDVLKARDIKVNTIGINRNVINTTMPASNTKTTTTTITTTTPVATGTIAPPASEGGADVQAKPQVDNKIADKVEDEKEDQRKRYRLMVKRRLLKRYGEELSTDAPTRKRQLEEFYREVEGSLLNLGAKLREEELVM